MDDYVRNCPLCGEEFVGWSEVIAINLLNCHIELYHQDWVKRGEGVYSKWEEVSTVKKVTSRLQDLQVILSNVLMFLLGFVFVLQVFLDIELRYILLTAVIWIVLGQAYAEVRANERYKEEVDA